MWVLDGRDDGTKTDGACVTDPSATKVGATAISAQCCEDNGTCRRYVGQNNAAGCIAGKWATSSYTHTTFASAAALCSEQGLKLCDQSCRGKGCNYDRGFVWTSLACPD